MSFRLILYLYFPTTNRLLNNEIWNIDYIKYEPAYFRHDHLGRNLSLIIRYSIHVISLNETDITQDDVPVMSLSVKEDVICDAPIPFGQDLADTGIERNDQSGIIYDISIAQSYDALQCASKIRQTRGIFQLYSYAFLLRK